MKPSEENCIIRGLMKYFEKLNCVRACARACVRARVCVFCVRVVCVHMCVCVCCVCVCVCVCV